MDSSHMDPPPSRGQNDGQTRLKTLLSHQRRWRAVISTVNETHLGGISENHLFLFWRFSKRISVVCEEKWDKSWKFDEYKRFTTTSLSPPLKIHHQVEKATVYSQGSRERRKPQRTNTVHRAVWNQGQRTQGWVSECHVLFILLHD